MHDAHDFLRTLAVVLCVAAVTTVIFQRLRQPVVFGYLFAGMIVGPHVPIPIVADEQIVRTLAETGVILLLFSLGLEFSLRKLIRIGPTAGVVAVSQSSVMALIGYLLGQAFGWTTLESVYAGAIIAISSTTIIAKAFEEQRVTGKFTQIVLGVLIIEDLIGIFFIAILTAVSAGAGLSAGSIATVGMRLVLFLAALIGVGLLVIPRTVRYVVRVGRSETTLIFSMGICFAAALLALAFGYSVALGAFIAGSLVAESGHEKEIERVVQPVRDVFAAIFFVSVGTLIDPALVATYWLPVVAFTVAVIAGKVVAVTLSSFLIGYTPRTAVQAGMSLAQIGEFSFIIAGVGLATGATRDFLYPVAVAVSGITTLTTPWLIRSAGAAASYVDRKLPRPMQTFVTLYGSWIEGVRSARASGGAKVPRARRLAGLLLLDAGVIVGIVIATSLELERFAVMLAAATSLTIGVSRSAVITAAAAVMLPLLIGLVRTARQLGLSFALTALPAPEKGIDLAAAPRRALVVTVQLATVLVIALAVVVTTEPFFPPFRSALVTGVVLGALLIVLGVAFRRSAADLHGHARAGAEIIVAALARQMAIAPGGEQKDSSHGVDGVRRMLPGMGDPVPLRVAPGSAVAGRTLAEVNVRGLTGATILAILREGEQVLMPSGHEGLREGDVLAVVGSRDAVESARVLLSPDEAADARVDGARGEGETS